MRTEEMFPGYGNKIVFDNSKDLCKKLSQIKVRYPETNIERERYAVGRYLEIMAFHNFYIFPVIVENIDVGEGKSIPDFKINVNGYEYYLEVTIASTTQFMDEAETMKEGKSYEMHVTIDGENIEDINVGFAEVKDGNLSGRPVFGDMPEVLAGKILSHSILKKTKKLKNYEIDMSKDVELLLSYFFSYSAGLDLKKTINYTYENLQQTEYPSLSHFDRIHATKGRVFLFNILDLSGVDLTISFFDNKKRLIDTLINLFRRKKEF